VHSKEPANEVGSTTKVVPGNSFGSARRLSARVFIWPQMDVASLPTWKDEGGGSVVTSAATPGPYAASRPATKASMEASSGAAVFMSASTAP
jgi:hypothetical protein